MSVLSAPELISSAKLTWRDQCIRYLNKTIPEHRLKPIVISLLWADRTQLNSSLYEVFTQTGTAHILAISGLHVAWVLGVAICLGANRWVALCCGWLYVLFALAPPSAIRAMLMASVVILLPELGWIYVLFLTFSIHLLMFPMAITSMSTLLSYWAIIMIRAIMVFGKGGLVEFSLWLSLLMMPISLYFFHQWPIASLWLNLIIVPLFSLIVLPLIFLALFLSLLGVSSVWWWVYGALVCVVDLLKYFESWPKIYLAKHICLIVLALQLGLIVCLVKRPKYKSMGFIAVLSFMLFYRLDSLPYGHFRIVMLDVGQGLSVWIKTKNHAVLYDAGPKKAGYKVLRPFILAEGKSQLSHIIISHWDQDHVGGLKAIRTQTNAKLITSDPSHGEPCLYGKSFELDGVSFTFYHPTSHRHKSKNKNSCVLLVSNQKHSAILLGDIDQQDEKKLASRLWGQSVDLMVAAHHGSQGSNGYPLLYTLHPKIIWVSAGRHNPYHHPHKESMNRFYSVTNQVKVTAIDGQQYFDG